MQLARRLSVSAVVGATGIVYGDIGTSPLYALEQALSAAGRLRPRGGARGAVADLLGADHLGDAQVRRHDHARGQRGRGRDPRAVRAGAAAARSSAAAGPKIAVGLALAGTAFFFCDALITPAISVLGAVEGLEVLSPDFKRAVMPVTIGVIAVLFAYQRRGTARVGSLFGPIMVVWFVVIAVIGAIPIVRNPQVLAALNPLRGPRAAGSPSAGGARDHRRGVPRGHRRRGAVRGHGTLRQAAGAHRLVRAGVAVAGAQLLRPGRAAARARPARRASALSPGARTRCCRGWWCWRPRPRSSPRRRRSPARSRWRARRCSSICCRACGCCRPRRRSTGQIYVPIVNWLVFLAVVLFVVGFGSSDALGGAYGAAVVGTMVVTTILGAFVAATQWNWPKWQVGGPVRPAAGDRLCLRRRQPHEGAHTAAGSR